MLTAIITGTSSGIGKALAELYLEKGVRVMGIGRRHSITHPSYAHLTCDLSDLQSVEALSFAELTGNVLLINNAGMLGKVERLSDQHPTDIARVLQVNVTAPAILMGKLAQHCGDLNRLTVVNISSGAAKRAIPSWTAYCASKAAIEMLSETFYLEEREKGRDTHVYCVAPGVVDTTMQQQIRGANTSTFSSHKRFQDLYQQGELKDPATVADQIHKLLSEAWIGQVRHVL